LRIKGCIGQTLAIHLSMRVVMYRFMDQNQMDLLKVISRTVIQIKERAEPNSNWTISKMTLSP